MDDDLLFGRDMRHRPGPRIMPTSRSGRMLSKYEGYGDVPDGFVTVDISTLDGQIPKDARWLSNRKLCVSIKDFARARKLTIHEQWTLFQHLNINLFYNEGNQRRWYPPSFKEALITADKAGKMSEFTNLFWDIRRDDPETVKHLEESITVWQKKLDIVSRDVWIAQSNLKLLYDKVNYNSILTLQERKKLNMYENCVRENEPVRIALEAKVIALRDYIEIRSLEF